MIHVDIKQLARFEPVGPPQCTGDRRQGSPEVPATNKVHVAIDDATRLAYVRSEWLHEQRDTLEFLAPCRRPGSLSRDHLRRSSSDNRPLYRSGDWRKACRSLGSPAQSRTTKALHAADQGSAERFMQNHPGGMGLS